MSFTTLNTFNSNLWKGGVIKPTLYGLSVKAADLNVNSINLTYRYSGVSYVMIDMIGSSGYISSQPQYNVTSSPVTQIITGLDPNTYYNFVLVPYDKNDISGSSYYFNGFTSGASTFTSSTAPITSISTPINYSNLSLPFCTLSKIYNLVVSAYDFSSVDLSFNYTNLSYVSVVQTGNINNSYNKNFNELSGTYDSTNKIYSLNSKIQNSGLTMLKSYSYNVTPYNNLNIAGTSLTVSGVSWPSFLNNINGNSISSYSNVTQLSTINNYILITYTSNGSIKFNKNIIGNTLLVGGGSSGWQLIYTGGSGYGGTGGNVIIKDYSYTLNNQYNIIIGTGGVNSNGTNTKLNDNNITLESANGGILGFGGVRNNVSLPSNYKAGDGGYGAGGPGGNPTYIKVYGSPVIGGNGGPGIFWPINGSTYSYGGGGGVNINYDGGAAGVSLGGGNGGYINNPPGIATVPGSGGGGQGAAGNNSGNGANGICIIAVPFY